MRFSMSPPIMMFAAVLALAGCTQKPAEDAAADPAAEAPATDDAALMAAAEAAAKAANDPNAAVQPDAGATPGPAADASAPAAAAAAGGIPGLVKGRDYTVIGGGEPYEPLNGKIELVEVFGYTCPHCASFEPILAGWKAGQPSDVRVTAVAAPFGGYWEPYAKAFFAAQSMGVLNKTHDKMFEAIHQRGTLPASEDVDPLKIGAVYAEHAGVDAKQFASAMESFSVQSKMNRAKQFITSSGVSTTPSLVVNGRYRVGGNGFEDMLRIAETLIAHERQQAAARTAQAPAPTASTP